jgi:parvulin-like peptidyl-prolyl isomerase
VPRDWFAKWVVDLSDAATDAWVAENTKQVDEAWKGAKDGFKASCPLVSEILVPFGAEATEETKIDKRREIDQALARLKAGESFETVAKTASANASAVVGGELGCLGESYGPGSKELTDALKGMKPGGVSPVVETATGFHLLKLGGTLAAADVERVGRRIVARKMMARFRADELAKEFAGKLAERTKNKTKLDEELVKALAEEYAARGPVKAKPKAKPKPKPSPAAGTTEPPAEPPADESGHPALADANRPKVEVTAPFPVMGAPVPNALPEERPATKLFELEPDQTLEKPVGTQDGLAVVQLKEKTVAKKDEFEKNKFDTLRALRETKGREALMRYVAALRTESKDKIKLDAAIAEESGAGADDGEG